MNDPIDRRAAIEHLKKRLYETEFNSNAEYPYYQEIADNRVDVWMNEVPSAQQERKTGLWIEEHIDITDKEHPKSFRFYRCSACGRVAAPALFVGEKWLSYCPHCGAYMKGENDE